MENLTKLTSLDKEFICLFWVAGHTLASMYVMHKAYQQNKSVRLMAISFLLFFFGILGFFIFLLVFN